MKLTPESTFTEHHPQMTQMIAEVGKKDTSTILKIITIFEATKGKIVEAR